MTTDADRAKAAEVMRGQVDYYEIRDVIAAALASERAAAVADLRARVEAVAEFYGGNFYPFVGDDVAKHLRAAVTNTTGGERQHTAECYEHGCTTGSHPAPRPGHRTGGPWTPEQVLADTTGDPA